MGSLGSQSQCNSLSAAAYQCVAQNISPSLPNTCKQSKKIIKQLQRCSTSVYYSKTDVVAIENVILYIVSFWKGSDSASFFVCEASSHAVQMVSMDSKSDFIHILSISNHLLLLALMLKTIFVCRSCSPMGRCHVYSRLSFGSVL